MAHRFVMDQKAFPRAHLSTVRATQRRFNAGVRATLQQRILEPTTPMFNLLGISRVPVFERHQRSDFSVEKLCGMPARALAVHALARARGAARDGSCCSQSIRRQRRKVNKCRVADKTQTNQQTNTHYSFIGID